MSVRCLFVVSLVDSKLVYHKVFPTVEYRWIKEHPSGLPIPDTQDLVQPLLNELGVLHSTIFQTSRDSCQKKLEAPLFWIPSGELFWPVVIVECYSRLLCGIPFLDQLLPTGLEQSSRKHSLELDVVIILELLSKLSHIVQLSNVNKMTTQLDHAIQQYLPFGRASGYHHLELLTAKPSSQSKGMWSMRSKPRLDIQIKEEVRMVTSSVITVAELYGTVYATTVDAEGDYSGMNLNLQFSKLADLPTMLFHPSAVVKNDGSNTLLRVKHPERMTFQLCHYTFSLETPPIQAVLKIRSGESTSSSIYIQLHIASGSLRSSLSRLEVRLPVPSGGSIVRILTPPAQVMGAVSLQRDGTILLWNLTPLAASASSGSKLKEDMVLNIDVELSGPLSLAESEATVLFTSTATTVSGLNVSLVQPSDIKIAQSFEVKNSSYRVCNHRTAGMSNRQVSKD